MKPGRRKGAPKTGGRQKGTPNKVTVEVREAALQHGPAAVAELARLMSESESEHVRIAACREILDRAYGKSRQSVEHTGHDHGPMVVKKIEDKEAVRRLATFLVEDGIAQISKDGSLKLSLVPEVEVKDDEADLVQPPDAEPKNVAASS